MDAADVGRRVSAARKRAGIATREELTARTELPRVGPATLGKIERGERPLYPHEAEAFARVLGVRPDFFYEKNAEANQLDVLEANQAAILKRLDAIVRALGITLREPPAAGGETVAPLPPAPDFADALRSDPSRSRSGRTGGSKGSQGQAR